MKCALGKTLHLGLSLLTLICVSCGRPDPIQVDDGTNDDASTKQQTHKREQAEKNAAVEQTLKSLASRHNAVRDWTAFYRKDGEFPQVFTLEFQNALKRLDGRPGIVVCRVTDVYQAGESYRILCHYDPEPDSLQADIWPSVTFLLEADDSTARKIVRLSNDHTDKMAFERYFAFAVLPTRMKVAYRRERTAQGEYIEDGEGEHHEGRHADAEIVEGDLYPTFEVFGRCLEVIYLENYDPW